MLADGHVSDLIAYLHVWYFEFTPVLYVDLAMGEIEAVQSIEHWHHSSAGRQLELTCTARRAELDDLGRDIFPSSRASDVSQNESSER